MTPAYPWCPASREPIETLAKTAEASRGEIGYPGAAEGRGGRRWQRHAQCRGEAAELAAAWRDAASEAHNAFGDARLYLEKYLERPRHIEIQILRATRTEISSISASANVPCSGATRK